MNSNQLFDYRFKFNMVLKMKSVLFSSSLIFLLAFTTAQENATNPATFTGENNATAKEIIEEITITPAKVSDEILNTTLLTGLVEENTTTAKAPIAEIINTTIASSITTEKLSDDILKTTLATVLVEENTTAKVPIAEIINTTIGDIATSIENITIANISFSNQTFVEATVEEIQKTIRYRVKNGYEKYPIYFSVRYTYAGNQSELASEVITVGSEGILDVPSAALNSWMTVWYLEDGVKKAAYGHSRKVHDPRTELCFEVCNFDLAHAAAPKVAYCLEKSCVRGSN